MSTICITVQGELRRKIFELWFRNNTDKLKKKPTHPFYIPPIQGTLLSGQLYSDYYNWQQTIVHHLVERGLADLERSIAPRKIAKR
jgi:hypothetical protein